MSKTNVEIYFKVDGIEKYITDLEDLKGVIKQVENATNQLSEATDDIDTSGFDELETKIETTEGAIKVLAGSFEILAGAAGALGLEDNEFFKGLEDNVINVIALADGAVNVAEGYKLLSKNTKLAAIAQRILNTAANANPYVILASAVIALAGAYALFKTRADDAEAAQRRINKTFNERAEQTLEQIDFETELARVRGELSPEKEIELNNQKIDTINQEILLSRKRIETAKIGDITEEEQELIDRLEENIKARQAQAKSLRNKNILIREGAEADARAAEQEAKNEAQRKKDDAEAERRAQRELARIQAIELAKQQASDAEAEIFDNQAQLEDDLYYQSLDLRDQQRRDLEDEFYERLNLAEGNAELEAQVRAQYAEDLKELENGFRDEDLEAERLLNEQKLQITEEYNAKRIQAEQDLQNAKIAATQAGFAVLNALAGDNEKLQDALFVAQKAFEAAQIFISGQKEITTLRAETTKAVSELTIKAASNPLLAPVYTAAIPGVIAAGTTGVNAIRLNTAAGLAGILAAGISQFKGGGKTPTDTGGGNLGGVSPTAALPNFQAETRGQDITPGGVQSNSTQEPIRAYVISTEVDNALQANQQIENLSRL